MGVDKECDEASSTIADKNQDHEIHKKTFDLMCHSFEEIPASELNLLNYHLLRDILKNTINLHAKQDVVFKRLVEWFRHDKAERRQHMVELLKLIRLEFMPSEFLMDEQLEAIYNQFNCFELILGERKSREALAIEEDDQSRVRSIFSVCKHDGDQTIYVEKYNKAANVFENASTISIGDRKSYEVQLHGNYMYVMGGYDSNSIGAIKSVSRFNMTSGKEEVLPEMHVARSSFPSILLGKYIYVFGGYSNRIIGEQICSSEASDPDYPIAIKDSDGLKEMMDSTIYTNSCERLDLETMKWTVLKPMDRARWESEVIELNGYIYIVGGVNQRISKFALDLYDPKNDEWHRLAEMDGLGKDGIEMNGTSVMLFKSDSFLYCRGDAPDVGPPPLHKSDASKNCWTQVECALGHLVSSVEVNDGIFGIRVFDNIFGKIHLNADDIWSFQSLARPQHKSHSYDSILFWN